MLGRELLDMLGDTARGLTRNDMDVTSLDSVRKAVVS
jgi:hypothetical protein